MMTKCFTVLLCLLFTASLQAQEIQGDYVVTTYSERQGLPSPLNFVSYRDHEGKLWLGNVLGLTCFDGTRFRTYTLQDGLPTDELCIVTEDPQGHLYAITATGIYIFDPTSKKNSG